MEDFKPEVVGEIPKEWRAKKIIQLYLGPENVPCLVIGVDTHANLLKGLLDEIGLEYELITDSESDEPIPKPSGNQYKTSGMGKVTLVGSELHWGGKSKDYGHSFDKAHLEEILSHGLLCEWKHIFYSHYCHDLI